MYSSNALSSKITFGSYLLLVVFFFVFYTLEMNFENLFFIVVSIIFTWTKVAFFIDIILSNQFIVLIDNNFDFVAKMISSFSYVIPF
jgi:hypothetical protein